MNWNKLLNAEKKIESREESKLVAHFTILGLWNVWMEAHNKIFLENIFSHKCEKIDGCLDDKNQACCFRKHVLLLFLITIVWQNYDSQESIGRMMKKALFSRFLSKQAKFTDEEKIVENHTGR